MKAKRSLALTASIAMLALTLFACEDKEKKQTPAEAATETTAESPTAEQAEAVAEKPAEQPSGGTFTDTRDNKTYKIVKIGNQTWFAENLNFEAKGSKCDSCQKYGRLYDWKTAKTACPNGWHLPSEKEWDVLVNGCGGYDKAGECLKAKSGWNNYTQCLKYDDDDRCDEYGEEESGNGTDEYGFSALPGSGGTYSSWWYDGVEADSRYMSYDKDGMYAEDFKVDDNFYSVRCIQN